MKRKKPAKLAAPPPTPLMHASIPLVTLQPTVVGPVEWIPCINHDTCGRHIRRHRLTTTGGFCTKCLKALVEQGREAAASAQTQG